MVRQGSERALHKRIPIQDLALVVTLLRIRRRSEDKFWLSLAEEPADVVGVSGVAAHEAMSTTQTNHITALHFRRPFVFARYHLPMPTASRTLCCSDAGTSMPSSIARSSAVSVKRMRL